MLVSPTKNREMDPASLIAYIPAAYKGVKELLPKTANGPAFGMGDPDNESTCRRMSLFMSLRGTTQEERRRVYTDPNMPLKDAKNVFGRTFTQSVVQNFIQVNHNFLSRDFIDLHTFEAPIFLVFLLVRQPRFSMKMAIASTIRI